MRKKLIILLAGLFLTSLMSSADTNITDLTNDALYLRASMYDNEGKYEEAAEIYEHLLASDNNAHIYLKLAQAYIKMNDLQSVKITVEKGLKKNPDFVELIGLMGDIYRMSKDTLPKSLELYKKAYDISKDQKYLESIASVYEDTQDFNSAISTYNQLIATEKKSEYYVGRAKMYARLGLDKESLSDYHTAADIDSNFFAASRLADYYLGKNDTENAVKYLKMIIQVNPGNIIAQFRLAEILKRQGQEGDAYPLYESILTNLEGNEKLYVLKQLGSLSYNARKFDRAYDYFKRAYEIDKDIQTGYSMALMAEAAKMDMEAEAAYKSILAKRPDFADARKRLAIIYIREKKADAAVEVLKGVDRKYADVDFYRILAEAYSQQENFEAAEDTLVKALAENDKDIKLRLDLAVLYDGQKEKAKAVEVVKQGLKIYPDNESFLNFLGYMYAEMGINLKEGEKLIRKALAAKPNEPAYLDSLGWILYKQGKYKDAYVYQKKAVKLAPEEQEIVEHMKAIMKKLGIKKTIDEVIKEN
ncbi:tetratricopeptide repeat protein [Seleniivibrio woodruffii]|uniref:Lipopolysaccharide biosynthesis regulator YciM n=1 Tax=Seleniivibrio woodruffii TaxID=1078050 RepID=A0A4R1KFJ5_9BACT|nr:tetratricopeptide repeat protein [Seleniivibrio woodruffii]TCK62079.1 lipopolysaccharide biosynthesis regulator YciM [Seleniivibrio woodruffii]TVZ34804.1 lipopolysaccharide biosynthesis regulator YciM [Seleniivibrio woodruffii]